LISRDEAKDVVDIWVIAKRLIEFPIKLLERIKWVKGKKPAINDFHTDLNSICNSLLATK